MPHVLAGDIGGTHTRFGVFDVSNAPRLVHSDVLDSRSFKTFEGALREFLNVSLKTAVRGKVRIAAATLGIAGPVVGQRVKTTNLPWTIDARAVARAASIPTVALVNDLVAMGLGAVASRPSKLAVIHKGRPKNKGGNLAIIAAGTGLGEASFVWDGEEHRFPMRPLGLRDGKRYYEAQIAVSAAVPSVPARASYSADQLWANAASRASSASPCASCQVSAAAYPPAPRSSSVPA